MNLPATSRTNTYKAGDYVSRTSPARVIALAGQHPKAGHIGQVIRTNENWAVVQWFNGDKTSWVSPEWLTKFEEETSANVH